MTAQSAAGMSHHGLLRAQQQEARNATPRGNLKVEPAPWLADAKAPVLQSSIETQCRQPKQRAIVRCMAKEKRFPPRRRLLDHDTEHRVGNLTD
jgi:hypothetical protein